MHRKISLQELIKSNYAIDEIISYRFLKHSSVTKRNLIEYSSAIFKGTKFQKTAVSFEMFLLLSIFENKNKKDIIDPFFILDFMVEKKSDNVFCIESLKDLFHEDSIYDVADFFILHLNKMNKESYLLLLDTLENKDLLMNRYQDKFFLNKSEYHISHISTFFYQIKKILTLADDFTEERFIKILSLEIKNKKDQNLFKFFSNLR